MSEPRDLPTFRAVIELWASNGAMAASIGWTAEAVRKWRERDTIPGEWWAAVAATDEAKAAGLSVDTLARLGARVPVSEGDLAEVRT